MHCGYDRIDTCSEFTTSIPSDDSLYEMSLTLSVLDIFVIASVVVDVALSLALCFPGVAKYSLIGLISVTSLRD